MRTNFFQLLAQKSFDAPKEYETLWYLFFEEKSVHTTYSSRTLAQFVDGNYFRDLPFRGSFTSLRDMTDALSLYKKSAVDIEKVFVFCELLFAVLFNRRAEDYGYSIRDQRMTILNNINFILEKTNHEFQKDADGYWIIVEKNKATTMAAQLVSDTSVAFDLIEYNHFAIKGHLAEKKKILTSVAAYIEPILKSKALSNAGYKQLESDAGFVFNNFHIRHNNKEGAKAQDYIVAASSAELEGWYDKAYEIALSVIIVNDYLSIGKDIADIKVKYMWRT